jgi:hypothetical protein
MKFEWEIIFESDIFRTKRAKVFGGWIVRDSACDEDGNTVSMVFVKDPKHEWKIDR